MIVRDVMTTPVIAIEPTERLLDAFNILRRHQVKHLPVIEHGHLIGVLSDRDLLGHATRENNTYVFPRQTVESAMTAPVVTCHPDDPVEKAISLLLEKDISCLPVLEDGEIVGIVTSRSFLQHIHSRELQG